MKRFDDVLHKSSDSDGISKAELVLVCFIAIEFNKVYNMCEKKLNDSSQSMFV